MKSEFDPERIKDLYDIIMPLYAEYSGYEIAEAHKIIRREIEKSQEQARVIEEMAELEARMAKLKSETDEE